MIKINDLITDVMNNQWIVLDIITDQDTGIIEAVYVFDFLTQSTEAFVSREEIKDVQDTPENVSFLFVAREKRALKKKVGA